MTPTDHILSRLQGLKAEETKDTATNPANPDERAALLYKHIMSKKFRKYAVNPEYQAHILAAVQSAVKNNEPIKVVLVFGGYKLWRLDEAPEADWAELFALMYYTDWLKPVLALHKPGVWFDFFSDDVILEIMDNVPRADTERYAASFRALLAFIKPYLPANLNFTFNRVGDQYESYEDFKTELFQTIEKMQASPEPPVPTEAQAEQVALNVRLKPGQDSDPQWKEKVFLIHEAYSASSRRRPYYRVPGKIFLITRAAKNCLALGTTKRSVVKFWIGAGVLGREGDECVELIYSPNQLVNGKFKREKASLSGLEWKNFKEIRVII